MDSLQAREDRVHRDLRGAEVTRQNFLLLCMYYLLKPEIF